MKYVTVFLCLFCLLSSCTSEEIKPMTEQEIRETVFQSLAEERFVRLSKDEIEFALSIDDDDYESGYVYQDKIGATIDEIGIFVADDKEGDLLYQKLERYVNDAKASKKAWLEGYNPPEAEKLKNGTLFRYGNFMGYAFLEENDRNAIFKKIEDFYREKA